MDFLNKDNELYNLLDNTETFNIIENNSNKSNLEFFDAYILLITNSLKKNNFEKAEKFLNQSLKFQNQNRFNLVIFA